MKNTFIILAFILSAVSYSQATIGIIAIRKQIADTTPPSAPTGLSANQLSASEVSLSWTASTDNVAVAQYYVYESTNGASGNYYYVGSTTGTSIIVGGLSPSTQYWYTVKAIDTSNNISGASNSAEVYLFN